MSKLMVIVVSCLISLGALAAKQVVHFRSYEFHETDSLKSLPTPIRQQLGIDISGNGGVADKGEPFNATDLIVDSNPMRRLLAAGQSGDTWLVALEQGGRGYNIQVYLFTRNVQKEHWVLLARPDTLKAVTQLLPQESPAAEG